MPLCLAVVCSSSLLSVHREACASWHFTKVSDVYYGVLGWRTVVYDFRLHLMTSVGWEMTSVGNWPEFHSRSSVL